VVVLRSSNHAGERTCSAEASSDVRPTRSIAFSGMIIHGSQTIDVALDVASGLRQDAGWRETCAEPPIASPRAAGLGGKGGLSPRVAVRFDGARRAPGMQVACAFRQADDSEEGFQASCT
jgi:hypothetical protein